MKISTQLFKVCGKQINLAVVRRKCMVINTFIRKEEHSKMNSLSYHIKKLGKVEYIKLKANRKKGISKIRLDQSQAWWWHIPIILAYSGRLR